MFDFSMVYFQYDSYGGSGSSDGGTVRAGMEDEEIRGVITAEVALVIREAIP